MPVSGCLSADKGPACMQADLSNLGPPYGSIDYASLAFPAYEAPTGGVCNNDLPSDSTLNRYLFVVQYYVQQVRSLPVCQSIASSLGLTLISNVSAGELCGYNSMQQGKASAMARVAYWKFWAHVGISSVFSWVDSQQDE